MRKMLLLLAAAVAGMAAIAGCVPPESVNPLSDPATAKADPRLAGAFSASLDGGEAWLHFNPREGSAIVDVVLIGYDPRDGAMVLHYEAFPTQIGKYGYLNLRAKKFDDMLETKYERSPTYIFARYEIAKDGALTLSVMDDTPAEKAINKGEVQGKISKGGENTDLGTVTGNGTFLTADSAKLAAWVAKSTDPALFNTIGVFRKVDPKLGKAAKAGK
jgi:hypothetical protein